MNGLSGFALAGYLNDLEREKKKAYGAVDTLNRESAASDQYQGARNRTNDWLSSLSPEDLAKLNPEVRNLSSNFEDVGDVSRFDTTKRANELGLTSQFAGVEGIDDYLKSLDKRKEEKKTAEVDSVLSSMTNTMNTQRQKKEEYDNYKDIEDLGKAGKLDGYKPGTPVQEPKLLSNRQIFESSGALKYDDPRIKNFYDINVKDPEDAQYKEKTLDAKTTKSEKQPFNMVGARIKYDTPENRELMADQVDKALTNGSINLEQAELAKGQIKNGFAYDYNLAFMENGVEAALKRGVKVADEYALIEPRAATAGATNYAGTQGGLKGKKDAPDKLDMGGIDPNTGTAFTSQQKQDAAFAIKLNRANNVLDGLVGELDESAIDKAILSSTDNKGNIRTNIINQIKDPKLRQYAQAKLDFVLSTLRKESGAAISANEYVGQSARYFAQAGDDPETLSQKRNARIDEEANYRAAAGDAAYTYFLKNQKKVKEEKPDPYKPKPDIIASEDARIKASNTVHNVASDDEYNKLPSGTLFKGPDGRTRRKP